jgi:hypothetical protein
METLDVHDLQKETRRAWNDFSGVQQELADLLELDRSVISRAIRSSGRKHAAVQARIISYVREVPVVRTSTYMGTQVSHEWIIDP